MDPAANLGNIHALGSAYKFIAFDGAILIGSVPSAAMVVVACLQF